MQLMETIRKRRNLTEDTAETVNGIKQQIEVLASKQLQTQMEMQEWQEKITDQIENLMIAFHERNDKERNEKDGRGQMLGKHSTKERSFKGMEPGKSGNTSGSESPGPILHSSPIRSRKSMKFMNPVNSGKS
jgi:hypothetical protein